MNGKANKNVDQFSQEGYIDVVESAATTITFQQLSNVAAALGEFKAMVINRVEYYFSKASYELLVGAGDKLQAGLTLSDNITSLEPSVVQLFDRVEVSYDQGQVYNNAIQPIIHDFGNMPGGGKLVPVKRLYGAVMGSSIAAAISCQIRFSYTLLTLEDKTYYELVQALDLLV